MPRAPEPVSPSDAEAIGLLRVEASVELLLALKARCKAMALEQQRRLCQAAAEAFVALLGTPRAELAAELLAHALKAMPLESRLDSFQSFLEAW